jgi:hypothetical protein
MRISAAVIVAMLACSSTLDAQQRRRQPPRKPKPVPVQLKTEPAKVTCPESLGVGVRTGSTYCFVTAGRDPVQGMLVDIPPHTGDATLTFDLHNRHTFSEEQMRAGRGYAQYTAVIGILTLKGDLLDRAAVQTEFRHVRDLHDRIAGGAGQGSVKAVAPVGVEHIKIVIPADVTQVSLLGEILEATTAAGRETVTPGKPVAIVSNVAVEYRPRPAARGRVNR